MRTVNYITVIYIQRPWNIQDREVRRARGCSVLSVARTLPRALRPSKYRRFHWLTNLTYLKHGNSYRKDANHNCEQQNDDEFWRPVH